MDSMNPSYLINRLEKISKDKLNEQTRSNFDT